MSQHHAREPSIAELIARLTGQTTDLVREEIRLGQLELQAKGRRAGAGAGLLGTAGIAALYGVAALAAAAVLGIATALEPWLAALIMGLAFLGGAGIFALGGRMELLRATPPVPEQTIESVRNDIRQIRREHRGSGGEGHPATPAIEAAATEAGGLLGKPGDRIELEALRRDIEDARRALGDTVEALARKADLKGRVATRVQDGKSQLRELREHPRERARNTAARARRWSAANRGTTAAALVVAGVLVAAWVAGRRSGRRRNGARA